MNMEFLFSESSDGFGKVAEGESADGKYRITFSYSYRDGISWKLRRNEPWKVLFDYFDETYLCNDDLKTAYDTLLSDLRDLSAEVQIDGRNAFEKLKTMTDCFIHSYFLT